MMAMVTTVAAVEEDWHLGTDHRPIEWDCKCEKHVIDGTYRGTYIFGLGLKCVIITFYGRVLFGRKNFFEVEWNCRRCDTNKC